MRKRDSGSVIDLYWGVAKPPRHPSGGRRRCRAVVATGSSAELIRRQADAAFPRGVAYSLSSAGEDLLAVLDRLELWARRRAAQPE